MACLDVKTLLDYLEGRLAEGELSRALAHVDACALCQDVVTYLGTASLRGTLPALSPADRHLTPTDRIDRYELKSLLGSGGMGVVFAARDPDLDRPVAIKLLRTEPDQTAPPLRQRLLREAQAMARLSHPNVVSIYEVGMSGEDVFIAMEMVDGRTLRRWLAEDNPDWRSILVAYRQAGQALAAAHAVGIIHRDFKPDNALIDRNGRVRVADFGLARASTDDESAAPAQDGGLASDAGASKLTRTGARMGTPAYMAPEQHLGKSAGATADQFSFCVSLYEALWQQPPFGGQTLDKLAQSVVAGQLREPPRGARVPLWLYRVLVKGLQTNPRNRYSSMDALLAALDRDPARVYRKGFGVAAALCLVLLSTGTVIRTRAQSRMCRGAAQKFVGIWDDERHQAVQKAFAATGKPFAKAVFATTKGALGDYLRKWTGMYTETCEATRVRGDQSEAVMELRMECMERRRQEVRALVDVFAHADAQVAQRAPQAVASLPDLDECSNADALRQVVPPPTPQTNQRVAALRTRLAEASARRNAGQYAEALKLAEVIATDARRLGYKPVVAEALNLLATLQYDTGHAQQAATTLFEASEAADSGRYDHARADALMRLVLVLNELVRFDEAHDAARLGRAAIARAGGDLQLELRFDEMEGSVLHKEGRYDEALALKNRVLSGLEQTLGPDASPVGLVLIGMSATAEAKGDPDQAIRYGRRALSIIEKTYGTNHPKAALAWLNVGNGLAAKHEFRAAIDAHEHALAINEAVFGPNHPDTARALVNIGELLSKVGQIERALTMIERAEAIQIRAYGPEHPEVATCECMLADVLLTSRRADAALPHAERCVAMRERVLGKEHVSTAEALVGLGECQLAHGGAAQAVPPLERAIAILEHHPGTEGELPEAQFTLARALWDRGGNRSRALELAGHARQWGLLRPEVDAWLTKHR
jgi:tetratricopeptide (TPR) repeat protein